MSDLEMLTERARAALALARQEATCFDRHDVGTEHLLLGLIAEGSGLAGRILRAAGVDLARARRNVAAMMGCHDHMARDGIELTPLAKKTLQFAAAEARRGGHCAVDTEHILLGLARGGAGIATNVLEDLGVAVENIPTWVAHARDGAFDGRKLGHRRVCPRRAQPGHKQPSAAQGPRFRHAPTCARLREDT